jgi:hypothetical protein
MRKFGDSLPGHIFSVILATLSAAGIIYLLLNTYPSMNSTSVKWVLIVSLGLTAGLTSRFLLADRWFMLQLLTSVLGLLAGLVLLGFLSQGPFGGQLPEANSDSMKLNWVSPLSVSGAAAFITLLALKKNGARRLAEAGQDSPTGSEPFPKAANTRLFSQKQPRPTRHSAKKSAAARKKSQLSFLRRGFWELRWSWWKHGIPEAHFPDSEPAETPRRKTAVRVQLKHQPRKQPARQKTQSNVHLIGKEEHRCPYCLELVNPKDPRGVNICPICHTHHHADCWAVTGTCQVPHFHQ